MTKKGSFTASLLFADIRDCADLSSDRLSSAFFEQFFPRLGEKIADQAPLSWQLWGDALFCLFADTTAAAHCALEVRDFFRDFDWKGAGLPRLSIRISLQVDWAFRSEHPFGQGGSAIVSQLNLAARVEPMLRPGEVWVSDAFADQLRGENADDVTTDSLGIKHLSVKWGGREIHRLRRTGDPPLTNDDIYEKMEIKRVDPVAILLALYERGDDQQQLNAVQMLGKQDDPRAQEKLCSIACDGSLSLVLRLEAIVSLGRQRKAGSVPVLSLLMEAEEKEDPRIQLACLNSLVSIADPRSGEIVVRILQKKKHYQEIVVRRAMATLAQVPNQLALDFIAGLLNDRELEGQLLITALNVLTIAGYHRGASAAIRLLERKVAEDIRQAALIYLVHRDPHVIKSELQAIARDTREALSFRIAALAGLTRIDSNETKIILAEIAEAAEALSSYAAQFLVEGSERVAKFSAEFREEFLEKCCGVL